MPRKWLTNESVWVRIISLWLLSFLLLFIWWLASYYFLPYGVLRGVLPSAELPIGNDFLSVFLPIFLFNLVIGGGLTVAINLLSVKSIPLGYFYPLINISLYGIFLGTDSFGISHGSRFFPSITVVYGPGFYELTGFIFIAAATARLTLFNQTGWLSGSLERVKNRNVLKLTRSESYAIIFGVLLLVIAATKETLSILNITI